MNENYTDVSHHRAAALGHVEAVKASAELLAEELANPALQHETLRRLESELRRGLKLAEVHALLNAGRQLERIADALEAASVDPRDPFNLEVAGYTAGGRL